MCRDYIVEALPTSDLAVIGAMTNCFWVRPKMASRKEMDDTTEDIENPFAKVVYII